MYQHKRGDTFDLSGEVTVMVNGVRQLDLTGWTGASKIADLDGGFSAVLTFSWVNAATSLVRLRNTSTASWPVGVMELDVEFTSPAGDKVSTATAQLACVKDITS